MSPRGPHAIWIGLAVVVAAVVVLLCAANPTLIWFVLAGVVLAVAFWFPKPAAIILPVLAVTGGVGLALLDSNAGFRPFVPQSQDVRVHVQARYDPARAGWALREVLTAPTDALEAVAEVLRAPQLLTHAEQVAALDRELRSQGWLLLQEQNGEPVFERGTRFIPGEVANIPLRSTLEIPVPPAEIGGFLLFLTPGDGSTAELVAPTGLVVSTAPPSEAEPVPDGELRNVDLARVAYSRYTITVEAASPLARYEPLRSLPDIAQGNLPGYVLAGTLAIGLGLFKDRATAAADRLLRHRPETGPDTAG